MAFVANPQPMGPTVPEIEFAEHLNVSLSPRTTSGGHNATGPRPRYATSPVPHIGPRR